MKNKNLYVLFNVLDNAFIKKQLTLLFYCAIFYILYVFELMKNVERKTNIVFIFLNLYRNFDLAGWSLLCIVVNLAIETEMRVHSMYTTDYSTLIY